MTTDKFPAFQLGDLVATLAALEPFLPWISTSFFRDTPLAIGVVDPEDAATNDHALEAGLRILSAYPIDPTRPCAGFGDNCVWIITEADRSVPTNLANTLVDLAFDLLAHAFDLIFIHGLAPSIACGSQADRIAARIMPIPGSIAYVA